MDILKRASRIRDRVGVATGSLALAIVAAAAGCSDGLTGPGLDTGGEGATVNLAVSLRVAGAAASRSPLAPTLDIVLEDGANTLVISRAAVVLREIELELEHDDGCDDDSRQGSNRGSGASASSRRDDDDDDACEEAFGPFLMEIPTDGSIAHVVSLRDVSPGVYDELEFDIHKLDDDSEADRAFVAQHPEFRRISILVEGSFNGAPFVYTSDLNEDQEIDLIPPLVVGSAEEEVNVTLALDIASWFVRSDGSLVHPSTANKGGPAEDLVEDNIEDSIEGFEDDDRDGHDDD